MRLLLDITPADKDSVDRYVLQGRYTSLEQFAAIAIRNQLLLEQDGPVTAAVRANQNPTGEARDGQKPWLLHAKEDPLQLVGVPQASKKPLPQFVTKLLPTKLVVRALLNDLVATGQAEVTLSAWAPRLSEAAVQLRGILLKAHDSNPRPRGDQFHPGLPEPDGKSMLRFHTYYGPSAPNPNSQSLVNRLGFVATRQDARKGDVRVALTPLGLQFAKLPNDVFDHPNQAQLAFTDAEQELLVNTIRERSPGDAQLMRWMLEQVIVGTKDRSKLHSAFPKILQKVVPDATTKVENSFFVATMSRLVELGAVALEKEGQFTQYFPGPRAKKVAASLMP